MNRIDCHGRSRIIIVFIHDWYNGEIGYRNTRSAWLAVQRPASRTKDAAVYKLPSRLGHLSLTRPLTRVYANNGEPSVTLSHLNPSTDNIALRPRFYLLVCYFQTVIANSGSNRLFYLKIEDIYCEFRKALPRECPTRGGEGRMQGVAHPAAQ